MQYYFLFFSVLTILGTGCISNADTSIDSQKDSIIEQDGEESEQESEFIQDNTNSNTESQSMDDWKVIDDFDKKTVESAANQIRFQIPNNWSIQVRDSTEQLGPTLSAGGSISEENGSVGFTIYNNFNGGFECSTTVSSVTTTLKSGEDAERRVLNTHGNPECNTDGTDLGDRMILVRLPTVLESGSLFIISRYNEVEFPDWLELFDQILSTFELFNDN